AKFKTMLKSDILSMEEPGEIASLINPWVYKDYEKRRLVLGELDAMDLATVNKAVKKYFTPDSYKLIIAGDPVALAGQLGKIQGLRKIELSEIERDQ
ncbi:MAG TPA: hypothetical protein VFU15_03395, partial [Bacteroidia bacterium]|nr:hypothetical protein [Bacteroidia bacterium]